MAPMAGIRAGPIPPGALGMAARAAAAVRLAERPLWRGDIGNVGGRMTSCPDRQADKIWWKTSFPEIASGPPSWGWLGAALRSVGTLNAARLERIDVPLLIMASRRDPVIDVRALVRLAERLPAAELRLIDGKGHELLREADRLRLPVLAAIDHFFDRLSG
jgi:lysophospholipase